MALSGDPEDIYRTDEAIMELFPEDEHLHRWLKLAREQVPFRGAASPHLLAGLWRARQGRPEVQRDGGQMGPEGARS